MSDREEILESIKSPKTTIPREENEFLAQTMANLPTPLLIGTLRMATSCIAARIVGDISDFSSWEEQMIEAVRDVARAHLESTQEKILT